MRNFGLVSIVSMICIVLVACGGTNTEEKNEANTETNTEENVQNSTENNDDANENKNDSENKREGTIEDQLDLSIGDTGTFDTTLGQYEVTLDKAELIEGELEGEKSTRDGYMLLDVTVKNITDETLDVEDLMYSMEVTDDLDYTGSQDHSDVYDTVEGFVGDIEPGEELSAQFLTIVDDSEEYFFRKAVGNIGGESSNQVVWSFDVAEAKKLILFFDGYYTKLLTYYIRNNKYPIHSCMF